jgi:hypothetical protein
MSLIFTLILYLASGGALLASFLKDRGKTKNALRKSWKAFEGIFPQFLGVIVITGVLMAAFDPDTISRILGARSGWAGVIGASVAGAVTLIPGFRPRGTFCIHQAGSGYSRDHPDGLVAGFHACQERRGRAAGPDPKPGRLSGKTLDDHWHFGYIAK